MMNCPRKVRYITSKLNLKKFLGTAKIIVEHVETVRDWKSWPLALLLSFIDSLGTDRYRARDTM